MLVGFRAFGKKSEQVKKHAGVVDHDVRERFSS